MLRKILLHVVVSLAFSACLLMIGTSVWTWYHTRTIGRMVHSWKQPKEIDYKSFGPYTLFVREREPSWAGIHARRTQYEIFIGHDENYGHWFDCTFHAGSLDDDEIDSYIRRSTVEWTDEGVSIKQESGHVIFFPKKTFIGGR